MAAATPRVFTIAADRPFLDVLAEAVLAGFPLEAAGPPAPVELARWTILLPTRRAVRELESILFAKSGGRGLLLPAIRPIGDIDEDTLGGSDPGTGADVPEALSAPAQLLLLIDLIDDWARANPQTRLAQEVAEAPHQAAALALSLQEFLDAIETEEVDAALIPGLYDLENARHRDAILEFLSIARERYPMRLDAERRISAALRRALVLRHEARRLAAGSAHGPIIAAGSTGTIPATRDLLKAIAGLPQGAVVLPGLDTIMDKDSWEAVGPVHPQHALKQLIAALGVPREDVPALAGAEPGARAWLASEIMRPAETSDGWNEALTAGAARLAPALAGVELIAAQHRQEEAAVIALILRNALETPGRSASLVTPDRSLARRVKAELMRWDIAIDDSGGEPLLRFGGAALLHVLTDAAVRGFDAVSLSGLMRHALCRLGRAPDEARHLASIVELAALRSEPALRSLAELPARVAEKQPDGKPGQHLHPVLARVPSADWAQAIAFAADLAGTLAAVPVTADAGFGAHVDALVKTCETLAGEELWAGDAGAALAEVIAAARAEAFRLQRCDFARAAAILVHLLRSTALRPRNPRGSRLSILGLLEARLMQPDLVVLGGLNEGIWPGLPDSGPWLNRPMRDTLAMQQPERSIGQTAHDFVQAFGAREVKLVWSRRIDDAPAIPSRWVLRLQMILKAAGQEARTGGASNWPRLARALNEPASVKPNAKPRPRPPLAARPRQLSVTRIETLIRDPYAIYARHVLKLQPVEPIVARADPARRGMVIHAAISDFLQAYPDALPADALAELLRLGHAHFAAVLGDPAVFSFWWPRFARIADWFVAQERLQRPNVERIHAEIEGRISLPIAGEAFDLTCRADRVDVLKDGTARIIDYKTGAVPSAREVRAGLAPQLTLQAAILNRGGFGLVAALPVSAVSYVRLSGGEPAGEGKGPDLGTDLPQVVAQHVAGLVKLVAAYRNADQPYLPRAVMKHEDDESDYDHLSRYREWALGGEAR